ncbi:hypothetical protein Tco_1004752 [Tanacetum coccineum]|uniref:Uncharacterized protein n=1 Tax=Tanacetum coccineum TaxID=301880 RepID=A0ABQ5FDX0_9ASTR
MGCHPRSACFRSLSLTQSPILELVKGGKSGDTEHPRLGCPLGKSKEKSTIGLSRILVTLYALVTDEIVPGEESIQGLFIEEHSENGIIKIVIMSFFIKRIFGIESFFLDMIMVFRWAFFIEGVVAIYIVFLIVGKGVYLASFGSEDKEYEDNEDPFGESQSFFEKEVLLFGLRRWDLNGLPPTMFWGGYALYNFLSVRNGVARKRSRTSGSSREGDSKWATTYKGLDEIRVCWGFILQPIDADVTIAGKRGYHRENTFLPCYSFIPGMNHVADFHYMGDAKDFGMQSCYELGKNEADTKALITVNTLENWKEHESGNDEGFAPKEYGMVASCGNDEGAAEVYSLITRNGTDAAAGEFALMGMTSEVCKVIVWKGGLHLFWRLHSSIDHIDLDESQNVLCTKFSTSGGLNSVSNVLSLVITVTSLQRSTQMTLPPVILVSNLQSPSQMIQPLVHQLPVYPHLRVKLEIEVLSYLHLVRIVNYYETQYANDLMVWDISKGTIGFNVHRFTQSNQFVTSSTSQFGKVLFAARQAGSMVGQNQFLLVNLHTDAGDEGIVDRVAMIVLAICDKKNRVLFTDTDCLVLSNDFKLPDESMVLLRVPRKHNLYTFNLNNLAPKENLMFG